ncbi:palmitoyl transferase [Oxalobacteraceae bacterium GrIS 2.11]
MNLFNLRSAGLTILFTMTCSSYAQTANNVSGSGASTPMPVNEQPGWLQRNYDGAQHTVENLYDNGRLSMILSGYAYHYRGTYDQAHLHNINERTWGLGMDKELRDEKDNEESIQFLVLADSHERPQISASYSHQWMKPISGNWELGAGYQIGLVSRSDIFSGVPFPAALPIFSVGTHDTKLLITFVPHISGTVNGNVLLFALRTSLK